MRVTDPTIPWWRIPIGRPRWYYTLDEIAPMPDWRKLWARSRQLGPGPTINDIMLKVRQYNAPIRTGWDWLDAGLPHPVVLPIPRNHPGWIPPWNRLP